jgi:hypothetical protein
VRAALVRHSGGAEAPREDERGADEPAAPGGAGTALEHLCATFSLSPFERDVLLLCAGMELDSKFAGHCAAASGDPRKAYPTFSLALAAIPEPHWSALLPVAPVRRWRLVEPLGAGGDAITTSPLRIDERILHYLAGLSYVDERLHGTVEPVALSSELPPSQAAIAERIADLWHVSGTVSGVQLFGKDASIIRDVAAAACASLGIPLRAVHADDIPHAPAEREAFIRLWERESLLTGSALLVQCDESPSEQPGSALCALVERLPGPLFVAAREPLPDGRRPLVKIEVRGARPHEQQEIWRDALGPIAAKLNGDLDRLTAHFDLDARGIRSAGAEFSGRLLARDGATDAQPGALLWDICRGRARRHLDGLAQRIEPVTTWDDLVLPEPQRQTLREMALHVRQRATVYERWGFAKKASRGLGITALFAGASGTGKTLAAEVLANELKLDLICVDGARCRSKWLGETEKNLARIFDAAACSGAILLFDEADAFFGKRSEVKDSHDRYANVEISYLLQRMDSYRGLAILTTNMKAALDAAFLRRIRFIVQFPFPDAVQRAEIWRRMFPREAPTEELDMEKLARLNVPGGNIRNIALSAAFLAADAGEPVRMTHLLRAARSEYEKIEKPLTTSETGGWL